ncbi:DEXDc domain containing protein [uncultured Caudovirales phage]|uniref:DEXDc domain containing protein n=1 Tax=uncultured Caudovirales phage TaxID=2100421 RepID=A0A6J5P7W6_9CAUD|nr:DEXDc domain containing protein [uncultured Caudovirales phage]
MKYADFLASKKLLPASHPIPHDGIHTNLFQFQKQVAEFALNKGRAALFLDTGLGKTITQCEWARHVPGEVLIVAPLAVASQTVREARERLGMEVVYSKDGTVSSRVTITNYERLEKFDCARFKGVVLDESSILKGFMGKTKQLLCDSFSQTPYRLACTATPAPNDHMELGNHSQFLGVMPSTEMLARWFINDPSKVGAYRVKGHAESDFWQWVGSWAACISKPSDLGFDDGAYNLPPLKMHTHTVNTPLQAGEADELFAMPTSSATDLHRTKRLTIKERCELTAELVDGMDGDVIVWCESNDESSMLARLIPGSVEVQGSDSIEKKEAAANWFCGYELANDDLRLIGKHDIVFTCGNPNTPPQEKPNINPTKQSEKGENCKLEHPQKMRTTCENTTPLTNPDTKGLQSSGRELMTQGEQSIKQIPTSETKQKSKSKTGSQKTQKNENLSGSESLELLLLNTTQCSNPKAEDAPSVDMTICQTQENSPLLITATQQDELGGYCVTNATLQSVSLTTLQSVYAKLSNTSSRRVLISKPSIFGFGLNFQHASHMVFASISYSYESFYQAIRREWRFGQKKPVNVHVVISDAELPVWRTIERKAEQHDEMKRQMVKAIMGGQETSIKNAYVPRATAQLPAWLERKSA